MPLKTAQSLALNLSKTLMTVIVLIRTDRGFFALAADDFDGDPAQIVCEYDPWS